MTDAAWIGLATLGFLIVSGFLGWLWSVLMKIGHRITELGDKIAKLMNDHEKKDQDRHEENVQRLTRLETLVEQNGNGHSPPRHSKRR